MKIRIFALILILCLLLSGCTQEKVNDVAKEVNAYINEMNIADGLYFPKVTAYAGGISGQELTLQVPFVIVDSLEEYSLKLSDIRLSGDDKEYLCAIDVEKNPANKRYALAKLLIKSNAFDKRAHLIDSLQMNINGENKKYSIGSWLIDVRDSNAPEGIELQNYIASIDGDMAYYQAQIINNSGQDIAVEAIDFKLGKENPAYEIYMSDDENFTNTYKPTLIRTGENKHVEFRYDNPRENLQEFINVAAFLKLRVGNEQKEILLNDVMYIPIMTSDIIIDILS